jgi:hypothetical protein
VAQIAACELRKATKTNSLPILRTMDRNVQSCWQNVKSKQ